MRWPAGRPATASCRRRPTVPTAPAAAERCRREALALVPIVPPERRRPGNITARLAGLADFPEFAPAIGLIDVDRDRGRLLAELTELFARVYLANVTNVPTAIAFIHGVTSLAALGHIAAHVEEPAARALLRYGWQAGCALYACYSTGGGAAAEIAPVAERVDSLIDHALANGDEHVIKFTEACLSRHILAPSPVYPAAVLHVRQVIGAQ